jgi:general secretion pathway protein E
MSHAVDMVGGLELEKILLGSTRLTADQLEDALQRRAETGERLSDVLVSLGHLNEDEVLEALGRQLALPVRAAIEPDAIESELLEKIPIGFAKAHTLLPLAIAGDGSVVVAVADPFDTAPLDDLRLLFEGAEVQAELANRRTIVTAINTAYDRGTESAADLVEDAADDLTALASEIGHEPQDLLDASDDAPIIRLVNSLLQQAVKERASDIHIEPFESDIRVRFRVDDVLHEPIDPLPKALQASVVSRMKIMGGLNIAEKRLPQDGRIRLKIAGRDYDVRMSTVPVAHGERVVMRLLPRTTDMFDLGRLGLNEIQLAGMSRLIQRPNGIVLVTGPTGSGKTTTLYAALSRINSVDKNIITIEDPVEIQLKGVGQIEVNPKIGLTFAGGLRSVLRQDPQVILVGEIRDLETAEIAVQASLTGHLVFSTLHTNDAPSAITRLVDMGVEPFLVGSSLAAVLAQRLIRVLCNECKEAVEPTPEELAEIGVRGRDGRPVRVYEPRGCARCNHTGYRGRLGIFELMMMDDEIRHLSTQTTDAKTVKRKAVELGMHTLRADGARKVVQGVTSIAELLRVTEEEGVVAQI